MSVRVSVCVWVDQSEEALTEGKGPHYILEFKDADWK